VSPQTTVILGYSPADWTSDPLLFPNALHADDRERALAERAHTLASGEPLLTDYRLVARDGRVVWVHDEAALVTGMLESLYICRDTWRKSARAPSTGMR
jgi:PAS domain-containing protein